MDDYLRNWIIKAENDLKTAKILLKEKELITDSICFHCQQSVEKYLKAFLIFEGKQPEKTHIIEKLLMECVEIDKGFIYFDEITAGFTYYAVENRYPDDFYIPSVEEAEEAVSAAEKIKEFVMEKLQGKGN
ncbi:MAG: HEPN domain-containing protein [Spirochaetales bacterium]|nr:HEPN domain-containing protein [Spirochaetales bacterium]